MSRGYAFSGLRAARVVLELLAAGSGLFRLGALLWPARALEAVDDALAELSE